MLEIEVHVPEQHRIGTVPSGQHHKYVHFQFIVSCHFFAVTRLKSRVSSNPVEFIMQLVIMQWTHYND